MEENQKRLLLFLGAGGVGKTSSSARYAKEKAVSGLNVALLSIDPARRLADALGLPLWRGAYKLTSEDWKRIGLEPKGSLTALMLDPSEVADQAVMRWSRSVQRAKALLDHRYYQIFSNSLAGNQEFLAVLCVEELFSNPDYDLVLVDTPPASRALEFLDKPEQLFRAFENKALKRWILSRNRFESSGFEKEGLSNPVERSGFEKEALSNPVEGMVCPVDTVSNSGREDQPNERDSQGPPALEWGLGGKAPNDGLLRGSIFEKTDLSQPVEKRGFFQRWTDRGRDLAFSTLEWMTGQHFLKDLAVFLSLFSDVMEEAARKCASLQRLLREERTGAYIVTTYEKSVVEDSIALYRELQTRKIPFSGFICHRARKQIGIPELSKLCEGGVSEVTARKLQRYGLEYALLCERDQAAKRRLLEISRRPCLEWGLYDEE